MVELLHDCCKLVVGHPELPVQRLFHVYGTVLGPL